MPRGVSKLKVVDVKNGQVIETQTVAVPTETPPAEEIQPPAEEIQPPAEEIQPPAESVVMKKPRAKAKSKAKQVEPPVETPAPGLTPMETPPPAVEVAAVPAVETPAVEASAPVVEASAPVEAKPKVKTTKPRAKKKEVNPTIIEKYVEKQIPKIIKISKDKIIKEAPNYDNIPEEIIEREIKKRQTTAKEVRLNKKLETVKKLSMNIA